MKKVDKTNDNNKSIDAIKKLIKEEYREETSCLNTTGDTCIKNNTFELEGKNVVLKSGYVTAHSFIERYDKGRDIVYIIPFTYGVTVDFLAKYTQENETEVSFAYKNSRYGFRVEYIACVDSGTILKYYRKSAFYLTDIRISPRVNVNIKGKITYNNSFFSAKIIDISQVGVKFESGAIFDMKYKAFLTFTLKGSTIEVPIEIVRNCGQVKNGFCYGAKFV